MRSNYQHGPQNDPKAEFVGRRSRWSLSLLEGRMNDAIEWRASQRQRLQQEQQQYQLQPEQARQQWVRKAFSRRTFRLGVCIVATTYSFLSFAPPSLSPYFWNLEDFQRRVLKSSGGGSSNDVENVEPFSASLLFGKAEVEMEPSIVRICREINDTLLLVDSKAGDTSQQQKRQRQKKPQTNKIKIVQETVHVCTSQSLFESMLTMYRSTMMLQTLSELGIGHIVEYNHDCHRFSPIDNGAAGNGKNEVRRTVQMEAHPNLLRNQWIGIYKNKDIKRANSHDELTNQCTSLLQAYKSEKTSTASLSPILAHEPIMTVDEMNVLMEFMKHNVHYAAMSAAAADSPVFHFAGGSRGGAVDASDASVSSNEGGGHVARRLLANPMSDAPSHDEEDHVFIYLDSRSTRGLPLHFYAQHIPRSATNVIILTSPNLHTAVDMIQDINRAHADLLFGYITELVPRARVEVVVGDGVGTLGVVRTILGAGTLICPPGLDCWIPAIVRGHGGWAEHDGRFGNRKRTVVVERQEKDGKTLDKLSDQKFTSHILILPSRSGKNLVTQKDGSLHPSSIAFLQTPPTDRAVCPAVRGRIGTWAKDVKFAARLQYETPIDHLFGFADQRYTPIKVRPYRAPTMYRWLEDKSLDSCSIQLVTLDSFCATMAEMNVGRLFFVGDFVGMNQAYSLWKLLGNLDSPKPINEREPSWIRDVVCPENGYTIQIQFTRNDMMQEIKKKADLPNGVPNCGGHLYCYRWTDKYMDYYQQPHQNQSEAQRTILITSFGPHFYDETVFRQRMADYLNILKVKLKDRLTKDLIFYRTIAPGHEFCNRKKSETPFKNFNEYRPTITDLYSWDLHDGFNDISERMVREFNDAHYYDKNAGHPPGQKAARLAPVQVLDVYPMSVLRRDGHVSGKDCVGCSVRHDCFHYSLPGPSDWWNHLLFSNLEDFAVVEKRVGHQ